MQAPSNQNMNQGQHSFQPIQYGQSFSKNEDPLEKLTNRMLKTAKYAEIRKFKMGNDPSFNRKNFNYFITDLQNVCELIPQTRNIFYRYPQSSPTANKVTDEALFILMLSRTEGYAKDLIKPLTGRGCEAIITLQRHCSQITPEDQARVRRSIILLRQQRNETATSYLRRLRNLVREAHNLNLQDIDETSIVDGCLQGFTSHRRYDTQVALLKSQKRSENPYDKHKNLTLSKIEAIFISIDENAPSFEKLYSISDMDNNYQDFKHNKSNNYNKPEKIGMKETVKAPP